MRSEGSSPRRTMRRPSSRGPGRITRGSMRLSEVTVMTSFCAWSVTIASSGIRIASYSGEPGIRIVPNWPGAIRWSGLRNSARALTVPEP